MIRNEKNQKDKNHNWKYTVVIQEDGTPKLFKLKGRGRKKEYQDLGYVPILGYVENIRRF